jgi:protein-arginine kinase activator protein McsA
MPKHEVSERLVCNTCGEGMERILHEKAELLQCIQCELGIALDPFDTETFPMTYKWGWWETCEVCGFDLMWVFSEHTKFCDKCLNDLLRYVTENTVSL